MNDSDKTIPEETGISKFHVPKEFKRCVFCVRWEGDLLYANECYRNKRYAYGQCIVYDRQQSSMGGEGCEYYEPRSTVGLLW